MGLWCRLSTLRIKKGHKQRCTSDVYSFEKMLETAVRNKSFVSLFSTIISRGTAFSLKLRPPLGRFLPNQQMLLRKRLFLCLLARLGDCQQESRSWQRLRRKRRKEIRICQSLHVSSPSHDSLRPRQLTIWYLLLLLRGRLGTRQRLIHDINEINKRTSNRST